MEGIPAVPLTHANERDTVTGTKINPTFNTSHHEMNSQTSVWTNSYLKNWKEAMRVYI